MREYLNVRRLPHREGQVLKYKKAIILPYILNPSVIPRQSISRIRNGVFHAETLTTYVHSVLLDDLVF